MSRYTSKDMMIEIIPEVIDAYMRGAQVEPDKEFLITVPVPRKLGEPSEDLYKGLQSALCSFVLKVSPREDNRILDENGEVVLDLAQSDMWAADFQCRSWNTMLAKKGVF